jgi:hypothetical protein
MKYSAAGTSTNALQKVAFVVEFAKEFTGPDFESFDKASKSWRAELPRRSVSNAVLFQPHPQRVTFDEEKIVGLSYEALMKDGSIESGLRFDENRIMFISGKYTNWKDVWPEAKRHLQEAVALVPSENQALSFASEYTDLFRAVGEYNDFDASNILRMGSPFIPEHIFSRNENFHFHTGYFENFPDPEPHRVLTRINADLRDNDDERSRDLSIVLLHKFMPSRSPWGSEASISDAVLNRGLDNFVFLHELDKTVLKLLINDRMSQDIGLLA